MTNRWYIVHTHSGAEKRVAQAIEETASKEGLQDKFEQVTVPVENVVDVKRGQKVNVERKFFPGYVLIKADLTDEAWHLVKNIPKVTGFLGNKGKPQPMRDAEVERIFRQVEEGLETPKHSVIFEVGETVKVVDGPFDSFVGVVQEIDEENEKITVEVSIFGRPTPVELEYIQVEKV